MSAIPFDAVDSPAVVMEQLTRIEHDLANRQNAYENAARDWYVAQREMKRQHAIALLGSSEKSVTEKKAEADIAAVGCDGSEHEAEYEALKAVIRVLETRATILMSVLKSQGRS